jgi:hypothetical protein
MELKLSAGKNSTSSFKEKLTEEELLVDLNLAIYLRFLYLLRLS